MSERRQVEAQLAANTDRLVRTSYTQGVLHFTPSGLPWGWGECLFCNGLQFSCSVWLALCCLLCVGCSTRTDDLVYGADHCSAERSFSGSNDHVTARGTGTSRRARHCACTVERPLQSRVCLERCVGPLGYLYTQAEAQRQRDTLQAELTDSNAALTTVSPRHVCVFAIAVWPM